MPCFCIVFCCICRFEPCHLSCLGSSVAEHSSREQSVPPEAAHFFFEKRVVSGVFVLCCVVLPCLLSRMLFMYTRVGRVG